MARQESTTTLTLENGNLVELKAVDGVTIEDVLLQGVKIAVFKLITGQDKFFLPNRDIRDFIVMTDVIGD